MEKVPKCTVKMSKINFLKFAATLVLTMFVVFATANNYAQSLKLSLSMENVPLKLVLKEIEKKSEFYFMYNSSTIDVNQKVTVNLRRKTIYEILDVILEKSDIKFEVINKQIVLTSLEKKTATIDLETNKIISGIVSDEFDLPLPGVNVVLKGTNIGTISDIEGKFSLNVLEEGDLTLIFSFIGYKTKEVILEEQTVINVNLEPFISDIEEVVVVGYGTSSKKLLTGSVSSVNSDELSQIASGSVESALQGKATGLQIVQNSGTPGSSISVKIRGTASIFGGSQPLYVIDGVPMTTGNFGQIGFEGQGIDAAADLNPADIESVSILKDASAAIYGARAANGVVLITTKKGKSGQSKISYRGYTGIQTAWKKLELLNATQWKDYVSTFDPGFVSKLDPTINTDWQDEVFRTASISSHDLSFTGGNDKTKIFMSGGYFNQEGIVLGSEYKKYSGRVNVDHKLTEKIDISAKVGTNYSINNRIVGDQTVNGVLPNAISKPPVYAVKDALGNYLEEGWWDNPVAIGNEVTNEARTLRNMSNLDFSYKISENLTFKNQTGIDFYNLHERRYEPTTVKRGALSNGIGIDARSSITKMLQQSTLNYDLSINDVHNFVFLAGYSFEKRTERYNWIRGVNFPSDNLEYLTSAGTIEEASSSASDEGLNSVFGRIQYNLKNKYIAEVSARRDGSSKFGKNNKYATLPAFSVAWRLSEENFIKQFILINELKLKAGFGLTGNDQIGNNRHQNLYISGNNYYNQPGISPAQIPNPDLKWETSKNFNAGIDLEILKRKIAISVEIYSKHTNDLLMPRPIPGSSGFGSYMANVGSLLNRGLEFSINTKNIEQQFIWTTGINMSFNRNKILDLYNNQPITSQGRGENAVLPNEPIGVFYMYKSLGVDPSTGDLVFEDVNNDGQITDADRQIVGNPNPDFTGGFTNSFSYKGFELRVFFQYSYGNDIFNGTREYSESMPLNTNDNQLVTVLDRWQKPGDVTYIPRINGTNNLTASSFYIEDGSYLRLKEISLGYNFSKKILDRTRIFSNIKLYAKGQNLLTFTNYSGLDPEVNYSGVGTIQQGTDFFTFPQARTFIIGLNLDF